MPSGRGAELPPRRMAPMPQETPPTTGAPQAGRDTPPLPPKQPQGAGPRGPESSTPTLRAPGRLSPPPSRGRGASWPVPPRAIPKQAPSPQVRAPQAPRSLLPAPRPLIAALAAAGSPGEVLSLQLLFSCNTRVPQAIRSTERGSSAGRASGSVLCRAALPPLPTARAGPRHPHAAPPGPGGEHSRPWPHRHIPGENPQWLQGRALAPSASG